ncbi:MAG: anaerobic C4-dicarboxylate transporter [Alphaproteobacteria bacterium]|jgi:anaerobic C4-dicarboxylate transporter DcuA|nr:anaerobic C4-dicarboxylate transporter [Alphaproteobacteria bacterium]
MLFVICFAILLLSIFLGVRLGGLGVAYAGGIGLFIYTMVLGIPPGNVPVSVVYIIVSVIGMIAILELSGGLTYLVYLAEKVLKKNPKHVNYLAPLVTFFLPVLAGTSHTAYSMMPVIVEVAKSQGIRPVRPLTLSVVASIVGIIASPISAAFVAFMMVLSDGNVGVSALSILAIMIPSAIMGILITSTIVSMLPQKLETDVNYQKLLSEGRIVSSKSKETIVPEKGPIAVVIFLITVIAISVYSLFPDLKPTYGDGKQIDTALLIIILMLLGSYVMVLVTKVNILDLASQSTFKAGMVAALCVIGVAWLGDTMISYYANDIKRVAGEFLIANPWAFAVVLLFLSSLLYSQAVTTVAVMPIGISLGLPIEVLIGSFAAVCGLFLLPTYPTIIAATQMDYTGTTRIGKYVFNHSFLLPGILLLSFTCIIAFTLALIVM